MANYNLELWSNEFAANLYETSDWFMFAKDWSRYVNGKVVHIPQAATRRTASLIDGSTVLPVAAGEQTYQDLTFSLDIVAATPRYISLDQADFNSFEARTRESEGTRNEVREGASMLIAHSWAPSAAAVSTSGTTTRSNVFGKASVKALTYADIIAARTELAKQKANLNELYLIVDPVMYSDILGMSQFSDASLVADKVKVDGYVGQIAGFKVIQRPYGVGYNALGALAAVDFTGAYDDTHFSAALAVDGSKVGYAKGGVRFGVKEYETGFYTDVMQASAICGGSKLYADGTGVVAIIEAV